MQITGRNVGRASFTFHDNQQQAIVVQPGQEVTVEVDDHTGQLLQRMSDDPRSSFKVGGDIQKAVKNTEDQRRAEMEQLKARHDAERRVEEARAQQGPGPVGPVETDGQIEGLAPGQGGEHQSSGEADESSPEAEEIRNRRRR